MPQVSEQHSSVRQNDAITSSLQLGLANLAENVAVKRKQNMMQTEAANKAADMMKANASKFKAGSTYEFKDNLQNSSQEVQNLQSRLLDDADRTQKQQSTAITKVGGTPDDAMQQAKQMRADQENKDYFKSAAAGVEAIADEVVADAGQTPSSSMGHTSSNSPTPTPGNGPANLMNVPNSTGTGTGSTVAGPTTGGTGGGTTGGTTQKTGSSHKKAASEKERESLGFEAETGDIDFSTKGKDLYRYQEQGAITDEVRTSIRNLSLLGDMRSVSNALTGATENPYKDLQVYRQQFIKDIQDKVGMQTKTIQLDKEQNAKLGNEKVKGQRGVTSGSSISIGGSTFSASLAGDKNKEEKTSVPSGVGGGDIVMYTANGISKNKVTSHAAATAPLMDWYNELERQAKANNKPLAKRGEYIVLKDDESMGEILYNPNGKVEYDAQGRVMKDFRIQLPRGQNYNEPFITKMFNGTAVGNQKKK